MKVKKRSLIGYLVLILMFTKLLPAGVGYLPGINVYRNLSLIAAPILVIMFYSICENKEFVNLVLIYDAYLFLVSLFRGCDLLATYRVLVESIIIVCGTSIVINIFGRKVITFFDKYMFIIIVVNLIMILTSSKMYIDAYENPVYLLSNRNNFLSVILPALGLRFSVLDKDKNKILYIINYIIYGFAIFYEFSATAVAVYILYGLMCIGIKKLTKSKSAIGICGIILCFSFLLYTNNNSFMGFVTSLLGKDMTFTGRTQLWAQGLLKMLQNPIVGHGISSSLDVEFSLIGKMTLYSCHNMYIQIGLWGGLVSVVLFAFIFISTILKSASTGGRFMIYALVGMSMWLFFEANYSIPYVWLLLTILNEHYWKGNRHNG